VLERIVGRSRNMLRQPSGDVLWPRYGSTLIGEQFPLRRQFRLVQTSLTHLVLEVALARPFHEGEAERLRRFVLGVVRYPFELEIREVAEIPRHPGGKFEDFVCAIP
jgi:phenylacetate-CoA ligase